MGKLSGSPSPLISAVPLTSADKPRSSSAVEIENVLADGFLVYQSMLIEEALFSFAVADVALMADVEVVSDVGVAADAALVAAKLSEFSSSAQALGVVKEIGAAQAFCVAQKFGAQAQTSASAAQNAHSKQASFICALFHTPAHSPAYTPAYPSTHTFAFSCFIPPPGLAQ